MPPSPHAQRNRNFLNWLILAGLIAFFIFVLFDLGLIAYIAATDSTHISQLILLMFAVCSAFIGYRSWIVDQEVQASYFIRNVFEQASSAQRDDKMRQLARVHLVWEESVHEELVPEELAHLQFSHTSKYLSYTLQNKSDKDITQLGELYVQALCGPHKIAWFVSSALIKLGLLGTVIGFVIMLSTVSDLEQLDISGVKQLMQQMTQGMGVAMFTTMSGLISSMLLSLQCLLLERGTDHLVAMTVGFAQTNTDDDSKALSGTELDTQLHTEEAHRGVV